MSGWHKSLAALALVMLLAAGGLWWLFMRGKGVVDETLALQTRLLEGKVTGRDRAAGVAMVTRNVDRMDRGDVKKVRDAFAKEWRRLNGEAFDEYIAAGDEDREALLDRDISRAVTAGELWFATNPWSNGQPPKPRKPKPAPSKTGQAKVSQAAQLFEAYRSALLARAKKRDISVPDWLLGL